MKKLKILLLFSFIIISIRCFYIVNNSIIHSKYNDKTNEINGIIKSYQLDGNYLKLEVKAKENIIVKYYFKTEEEKNKISIAIKIGDFISCKGIIEKPTPNTNFHLFNYQKYLLSKKIYWIFEADTLLIESNTSILYKTKNKIIEKIEDSENETYLKLFILGENTLDDEINNSYQKLGISHLFAISGMHISLLTGIILFILNKKIHNSYFHFVFLFIFLHFYMFLTNFSPSIIRAAYLFVGIQIKKIFSIPISNKMILGIIFFSMILVNPYYLYNVGFLFSFSISFGLLCASKNLQKYKHYFSKLFLTSLISFLISIPILIANFHQINLLSPLFNMIFVPVVSTVVFPIALLTFILPFLNPILSFLVSGLEFVSKLCSSIPFGVITLAAIPVWFYGIYYLILAFIIKKITWKKLLVFTIVIVIHSNIRIFQLYPIITLIDVGQGDSILIELPHNHGNILIDTGGSISYQIESWKKRKNDYSIVENITIPYLRSIGITKIDTLILTHGDYDHAGETIHLIQNFKIKNVFFNSGANNKLENTIIDFLQKKKISYQFISQSIYKIGGYEFQFLNRKNASNENEDSLIVYTKLNNKNILLMGDAGEASENYLINEYNLKKMDILKVGHHGSKYSTSNKFLDVIQPKYALISAGKNNRFGHPHLEIINKLNNSQVEIKSTNENGMIRAILREHVEFQTCLPVR